MRQPSFLLNDLEPRRLFADFSAAPSPESGFFGINDGVLCSVSINNHDAAAAPAASISVLVVLSLDQTLGNADDQHVTGVINSTTIPGGGTRTYPAPFAILPSIPAGDYYVATNTLDATTSNNVTFTPTPVIRVATAQFTDPTILGTAGNDVITFEQHDFNTVVTVNGASSYYENGDFPSIFVDGGLGNDRIFVTNAQVETQLLITGGGGADIIIGGNANDELSGGLGRDKLFGGAGDDLMIGGAENDYVGGEAGNDTMIGAGGNDRLPDVVGRDWFIGGNGNDTIIARDLSSDAINDPDTVSGNAGIDKAQIDVGGAYPDINSNLEELIP